MPRADHVRPTSGSITRFQSLPDLALVYAAPWLKTPFPDGGYLQRGRAKLPGPALLDKTRDARLEEARERGRATEGRRHDRSDKGGAMPWNNQGRRPGKAAETTHGVVRRLRWRRGAAATRSRRLAPPGPGPISRGDAGRLRQRQGNAIAWRRLLASGCSAASTGSRRTSRAWSCDSANGSGPSSRACAITSRPDRDGVDPQGHPRQPDRDRLPFRPASRRTGPERDVIDESLMLTGDENIIDIDSPSCG